MLSAHDSLVLQAVCLASVLLYVSLMWWRRSSSSHAQLFPPSPGVRLPLLGHLHLLMGTTHPHRRLEQLAKKHGPDLLLLHLGSVPVLVASTPEMAKEILKKQDAVFASRRRTAVGVHTLYGCQDISTAPLGPLWRSLRLVATTHLLTKKSLDAFQPVIAQEVRGALRSVLRAARAGAEVPMRRVLWTCANNIISRMSFGYPAVPTLDSSAGDGSSLQRFDLARVTEEMSTLFGAMPVGDFLPWLAWMDLGGYVARMKALSRSFDGLFDRILRDARTARATNIQQQQQQPQPQPQPPTLLDVLLSLQDHNKNLAGDIPLTDTLIKALLLDMFAAGTETWSLTVEWALLELINNPLCMQKLQEELQRVVGTQRLVEESDLQNLPYLHAVVKETARLHPVAPLLIPHESTEPCRIGKYYIPPKTYTFVNVWAIHKNSHAWPHKPLDFYPDRFLSDTDVDLYGQHFELLPFGSGRRSCPGLKLGLSNVCLTLASLVHAFDVWCPTIPLDTFETSGLTIKPAKPLSPFASPRLPMEMY